LQLTSDNPIQFSLASAYQYKAGITSGEGAAQVDANGVLYLPAVGVGNEIYEVRMDLVNSTTIVFGNLAVLSVKAAPPPPSPQPSPLQSSISAGKLVFEQMCVVCHGASGNGTAQGPSLISSSLSTLDQLRNHIIPRMPLGNPGQCVDNTGSSCATDVSNYILHRLRVPGSDVDVEGAY
jgi:mono/diheme cytochrome c family protein